MDLFRRHYALLDVLDHSQVVGDGEIAQLLAQQPQHDTFNVDTRLIQTLDHPFGQILLVVQEEAVLG